MKELIFFHLKISLPILAIAIALKLQYISALAFVVMLGLYCLAYHPLVSGLRLLKHGKIERSEFWKVFLPFFNWNYFSFLYFNKR